MRHELDQRWNFETTQKIGNRSRRSVVAVALLLSVVGFSAMLSPTPLLADVFLLTDGSKITGTVLTEEDGVLELWTEKGIREIPRSSVKRQRSSKTNYDRYLNKQARLTDTVKSRLALAKWCEKKNLEPQARLHFEQVLEINPDHTIAHQHLGHRKIGGKWQATGSTADSAGSREEDPTADEGEDEDFPPFVLIQYKEGFDLDTPAKRRIESELRELFHGAKRPMHFVTRDSGRHDYVFELSLQVEAGARSDFYGHGIQQKWIGRFDVTLTRVGDTPKVGIRMKNLKNEFTGAAGLVKSEAIAHTTRGAVDGFFEQLRKHRFITKRGIAADSASAGSPKN